LAISPRISREFCSNSCPLHTEDGAEPAERDVCSANALIEAAGENISHLVSERQAVMTCSVLPQISANREQVVQVIQNLLSNAIQNCATTPRVDTTFEETPDHWLFRVSDNGTGIAKQDSEKLFMPFKRMSHHKMQGPGLGLAICRKIIELHGGKIWFETKPTNGTDFIFSVAKGEPVVVAPTAILPSPLVENRDEGRLELATLLLVDDDDMAIELIQLIGANRLHCNVIVANDGQEAWARLHDRACGYLTKPPDFNRLRSILEKSAILITSEVGDALHLLRAA
jgi:hypothetical protein